MKPVKAWPDSTGKLHPSIESWQQAELVTLLNETDGSGSIAPAHIEMLATDLIKTQATRLIEILTTGAASRPAARKRAGTTNPRRAASRGRHNADLNDPSKPWNQSEAGKARLAKEGFKVMRTAVDETVPDEVPVSSDTGAQGEPAHHWANPPTT